jgi:alpha-beta hydrolase superfamily lysophospholipase
VKCYPKLYHEIMNEAEKDRDQVYDDIERLLKGRFEEVK